MQQQLEKTASSAPTAPSNERLQHIALLRRWGGLTSDALLDPNCHYFQIPGVEGLIGYKLHYGTAVVFGDPVCSPADLEPLTKSFHALCEKEGWRFVYISASEEFARWALSHGCNALIQFGKEFYIDPHNDPREKTGTHASLVRRKVRHATNEGTSILEYVGGDEQLEQKIDEVGSLWLEGRRGPQIHISKVRLFNDRPGKRWFYAKQGSRVVGAAVLNKLERYDGWLLNHIVFAPDAPHGTPELLVVSALEAAAKEGCHYVTFGNSPASRLGETQGLDSLTNYAAAFMFKIANKLFRLDGHSVFWEKFHPESRPSYLLFARSSIGFKELMALTQALNVSI